MKKQQLLICNVGWMREYRGSTSTDWPIGGGAYNKEHRGSESLNFQRHRGKYYGFVRPGRGARVDTRKLEGDLKVAENILVVWCAPRPNGKDTLVVGWYEDATVHRKPEYRSWGPGLNNVTATKAKLLPEHLRTFRIPRARRDGFGLGQANVHYPLLATDASWVRSLLEHVENHEIRPGRAPRRVSSSSGGRQVDPKRRKTVEEAAVRRAWKWYEQKGYFVKSVEKDNCGWDLDCWLGDVRRRVEVKGFRGDGSTIELTPNEWHHLQKHAAEYELCIVTRVLTNRPAIHIGRLEREEKTQMLVFQDGARASIKEVVAARVNRRR